MPRKYSYIQRWILSPDSMTYLISVASHPVYEAVFNAINAWSLMSLPLILSNGACKKVKNQLAWFTGIMFLTNVFYIPFMALRAAPEPEPSPPSSDASARVAMRPPPPLPPTNQPLPWWSPGLGWTSAAVGALSIAWALGARPEFGDLAERASYFQTMFSGDRVFYAFIVDAVLYSVWQAVLLEGAEARFRFIPFFGMAAYLITGRGVHSDDT